MNLEKIIFIVGPTAVGKTSLALDFAESIQGEIVSCDSMQVYREITIASAKPTAEQQRRVEHHLIDILSVDENFDVAQFNDLANKAVSDILGRGKVPVVVGGSGMYVRILLDGIFEGGERSLEVSESLKERAAKEGLAVLYEELRRVDSEAAEKIHAHDERRIVRALEVYQLTGRPISQMQKEREGLWSRYNVELFGITAPRERLYELINQRVEEMFDAGLVDEVLHLKDKPLSRTAEKIIGVQEIKGFLKHEYGLDQAKYLMQRNTRHFAKRQMTWFRKNERIRWFTIENQDDRSAALEEMIRTIKEN